MVPSREHCVPPAHHHSRHSWETALCDSLISFPTQVTSPNPGFELRYWPRASHIQHYPFSPLSVVQGAPPPHPHGAEELRPNPWLGCGVGEGRRRGRLLLARHKETSFSLGSMATLRGGSTHRILPTPPAGLGALAATHLRSAYLGWGRGDAAAGGLGAVSIFVSPAPGAQGSTTMGWDAKGAARGSVARVLELWGDPRGPCW